MEIQTTSPVDAVRTFARETSPRRAKDLFKRIHQHAGDDDRFPLRPTGAVDVFKDGQLVSTTRPCGECGQPLTGIVVNVSPQEQLHSKCVAARRSQIIVRR